MEIKRVCFEHFKSFKQKDIYFDPVTSIQGQNGSGKTNTATGVMWLFGDKDYSLSSNPNVRPEVDGEPVNDVLVSVEAICNLEGKEVSFKKIQRQTKNREGIVTGSENKFEVNSVPKTKRDFEAYIMENLGITIDQMIFCMNPNAVMSQERKKLRELILGMAKSLSDVEIAQQIPKLTDLAVLLERYRLDEIKAMNKASVTKLDKDIKAIPVRIDEVSKSIEDLDFSDFELQKNSLLEQISEKELQLESNESAAMNYQKASQSITEIRRQITDIERIAIEELDEKRREIQKRIDICERDILSNVQNLKMAELDIERKKTSIENTTARKEQLKVDFKKRHNEKFPEYEELPPISEAALNCPTCGQKLPEELKAEKITQYRERLQKHREKYDLDKADFEKSKEKDLERIGNEGKQCMMDVKQYESDLVELEAKLEQLKTDKDLLNHAKIEAMAELEKLPVQPDLSENQEYESLILHISKMEEALKSMNSGADYRSVLKADISNLNAELDSVKAILMKQQTNMDAENRIYELNEELVVLQQKKADCERILDMCETLSREKNNLLVGEINEHFTVVKWQLFEYLKNGSYNEVCIPTVDGYRFGDTTNEGREILARIDICASLQRYYDVSLPIFLDRAGELDSWRVPKLECQLMLLRRTDDKELKVEAMVMQEENVEGV